MNKSKANNNRNKKLKALYEKDVNKLTFDEIVFFSQALEDNKLKLSTEEFFERNPKFAASFIKKYREHVRKVCPNANINNRMGANVNNTFKNFNEGGNVMKQNGGRRKKKTKTKTKTTTKRRSSRKIKRKIHRGPRGGKYVIVNGKKKYL